MTESTDPYIYPGTDVLRNLRGIRDADMLARFEAESTTRRLAELRHFPIDGKFVSSHLKNIHRHIFQDVFDWAGEFRTVNISMGRHLFGVAAFVEPTLSDVLHKLSGENFLKGINLERFAVRAGFYLGEINAVHPFREGNGRSQREFIRELGVRAGFTIDWSRTSRENMIAASRHSATNGDNSGLATLIRACLVS